MRHIDDNQRKWVTHGVPLLVAGLAAMTLSAAASADSYRDYRNEHRERVVVVHEYERDRRPQRRHHAWRRQRPREVHVYHHYDAPPPPTTVVYREVTRDYPAPPATVVYREAPRHYPAPRQRAGNFTAQSLVGAALGGLIGSQIGGGTGNRAATAAGAVTGLWLGSQYR